MIRTSAEFKYLLVCLKILLVEEVNGKHRVSFGFVIMRNYGGLPEIFIKMFRPCAKHLYSNMHCI